jgi:hypothetical protein
MHWCTIFCCCYTSLHLGGRLSSCHHKGREKLQDETRWDKMTNSIVDSRVHPGVQPLFRSWLLNMLCRALAARICLFSGNWRCTPTCKEPLNKCIAAFFYCIILCSLASNFAMLLSKSKAEPAWQFRFEGSVKLPWVSVTSCLECLFHPFSISVCFADMKRILPLRSLGLKSKAREGVGDDMWQDSFSLTQTKRLKVQKDEPNATKRIKKKKYQKKKEKKTVLSHLSLLKSLEYLDTKYVYVYPRPAKRPQLFSSSLSTPKLHLLLYSTDLYCARSWFVWLWACNWTWGCSCQTVVKPGIPQDSCNTACTACTTS